MGESGRESGRERKREWEGKKGKIMKMVFEILNMYFYMSQKV